MPEGGAAGEELMEVKLRNGSTIGVAEVTVEKLRASRAWEAACGATGLRPQDLLDEAERQAAYQGRKA